MHALKRQLIISMHTLAHNFPLPTAHIAGESIAVDVTRFLFPNKAHVIKKIPPTRNEREASFCSGAALLETCKFDAPNCCPCLQLTLKLRGCRVAAAAAAVNFQV